MKDGLGWATAPYRKIMIEKLVFWMTHSKKIGCYSGARPIYEIHRRWWLKKWDELVERYRTPDPRWSLATPRIIVSHKPAEIAKKTHFDMCNQAVEIPLQIKYLESRGKINTPERRAWAKAMIEKSKHQVAIDYQKHGHPNMNQKDFKHKDFIND